MNFACYICGQDTAPVGERNGVTYSACLDRCCLQCPVQSVRYPDEADKDLWHGGRNGHQAFDMRWRNLTAAGDLRKWAERQDLAILDYGCGLRQWVEWLRGEGVLAVGYDPWTAGEAHPPVGVYGAVTMIEVVEHLGPDLFGAWQWVVREKLRPGGALYVQTQLWRGNNVGNWWYVGPEAGHISLVSLEGLERMAMALRLKRVGQGGDYTIWQKEGD